MKASMKQWRLALGLMLTWALLFLAVFSYFMESRVDEAMALSHADTRRLTSVQGNTRSAAVMISRRTLPATSTSSSRAQKEQISNSEQDTYIYPDAQSFATWSVSSRSGTATQNQEKQEHNQTFPQLVEEEDEEEVVGAIDEEDRNRRETNSWFDSNPEEFYSLKSKSVVQRLWQGSASLDMLSPRLQKAVKDYVSTNKHGVSYRGRRHARKSKRRLLCEMKRKAKVMTLDGEEIPFSSLGWQKIVPPLPLERLYGSGFGSCAVVTSAGAILHSGLGKEIDSHDAVLRFNSAPTKGYERDVGSKTTIRIINSQILANPSHQFNSSSLYKNVTLVAWDPAPYAVNLHKWYKNPDYNLFTPYMKYRKQFPAQPFYILHPKFIWQLWDIIQANTLDNIQPNPPSSGFIGILLMMWLCDEVDVYEYIPSLRQTDLCHYHERYYDAACTLGAYHPLLYEKILVQRLKTGSESDLAKGKVTLPGFRTIHCDP
ncbi:Beta-galactoside alpha-2,6-sialyltransferase 2 [Bagarius yarrelli]|uniref:Beta-galactoside alpha-2,6-sialyltransferase 2 n=1 Tax=Bagarius yarrelli TaxID=175774 RepID=A0A556TXV9_BAGYA|nr:Beta-galactoside alpha-2,6-sialyltransferase 2 [Bagarius yarrelli]